MTTPSDEFCDALARKMLDRCDVPDDEQELFVVDLLDTRALIRAAYRAALEDAAKVCDDDEDAFAGGHNAYESGRKQSAASCASAIRALMGER